jgi:uncharacterized protein (TIGR00251 family)
MQDSIRITDDSIYIDIKAVPGASKTEFAGNKDGRLRVRIAAAAEDGKANTELIAFFAKALGCPKRNITITSGKKSRLKTLAFQADCKVKLKQILKETEK